MVNPALDAVSNEIVAGIVEIHNLQRDSFWFRIHDHGEDIPDRLDADDKRKDNAVLFDNMSLCKRLGVSQDTFRQVLVKERVLTKYGSGYRFKVERAKAFFLTSCEIIDAEIEMAELVRNKRRYFIRLGNTKPGYFNSVINQVAAGVFYP